jgi:hypothetical protein
LDVLIITSTTAAAYNPWRTCITNSSSSSSSSHIPVTPSISSRNPVLHPIFSWASLELDQYFMTLPSLSIEHTLLVTTKAFLDQQQVSAIIHLVASSIPELSAKNVTIVDQNGNLLSDPSKQVANNHLDPSQLKYVQDFQAGKQWKDTKYQSPVEVCRNYYYYLDHCHFENCHYFSC